MIQNLRLEIELMVERMHYKFVTTQNYWVFGPYPSSSILKTREYNVSETGSVIEVSSF
jgi:hypothetical protein